ncbi:glycosyltransferase family 39 protein [Planctomycetota bacterium]|nr:glycosyltransferase family 39 protein [Planctomycetota bacterium]
MDQDVQSVELKDKASSGGVPWWVVMLVFLAIVAMYALFADTSTLWDRDEPRFARSAMEMYETGDWIVPYFNGDYRLHKPAGVYWLMDVGLWLRNYVWPMSLELAVRLPSVLGISLSALFTFFIGKRLFNAKTGLLAMVIYPTMLVPLVIGSFTAATADGALNAAMMLSIWMVVEILLRPRWWQYVVLTLALGSAWLLKGPVGFAVPGLMMIGTAFFGRGGTIKVSKRKWLALVVVSLIAAGFFVAWGLPANEMTGGQFYEEGIGKHVVGRSMTAMESHGGSGLLGYILTIPAYIPVLIVGVSPWVLFAPLGLSGLIRGHIGTSKSRAILWGWIAFPLIMFSLVATKLPHYVAPIFPALAIMIAAAIVARVKGDSPDEENGWLMTGVWLFNIFVGAAVLGGIAAPWVLQQGKVGYIYLLSIVLAVLTILVMLLITYWTSKKRLYAAAVLTSLIFPLLTLPSAMVLLPQVEANLKPSKQIAAGIHEILGQGVDVPVIMSGYEEPSLVFYINRPAGEVVKETGSDSAAISEWAHQSGAGILIITKKNYDKTIDKYTQLPLKKLFEDQTINYSANGKPLDILVMGRNMTNDMLARAEEVRKEHEKTE